MHHCGWGVAGAGVKGRCTTLGCSRMLILPLGVCGGGGGRQGFSSNRGEGGVVEREGRAPTFGRHPQHLTYPTGGGGGAQLKRHPLTD